MDSLLSNLIRNEDSLALLLIFGGSALVAIVAILLTTMKNIALNRERETSRREIAAYIAEGSMTPEDGAKLISASPDKEA